MIKDELEIDVKSHSYEFEGDVKFWVYTVIAYQDIQPFSDDELADYTIKLIEKKINEE